MTLTTGVGATIEFRELDNDRLQDFGFGDQKKKKLILLFPQDGQMPPPIEEPSETDVMKSRKRRKKEFGYEEENIVQDWTQKLLVRGEGKYLGALGSGSWLQLTLN